MIQCECESRGYCPRLGIHTTEHMRQLCIRNHAKAIATATALKQDKEDVNTKRKQKAIAAKEKKARIVSWLIFFRSLEDTGLGDTVERLLAKAGGRKIKHLVESLGCNCGCNDRQKWMNKKWPY